MAVLGPRRIASCSVARQRGEKVGALDELSLGALPLGALRSSGIRRTHPASSPPTRRASRAPPTRELSPNSPQPTFVVHVTTHLRLPIPWPTFVVLLHLKHAKTVSMSDSSTKQKTIEDDCTGGATKLLFAKTRATSTEESSPMHMLADSYNSSRRSSAAVVGLVPALVSPAKNHAGARATIDGTRARGCARATYARDQNHAGALRSSGIRRSSPPTRRAP